MFVQSPKTLFKNIFKRFLGVVKILKTNDASSNQSLKSNGSTNH
jgi:hypothetical protein